jgi:soluble cytochrome b562
VDPISDIKAPTTLPAAGVAAQASINEANLALTAAANVIAQNVKDRIWTKAQAQGYLDKVRTYANQVDRAQQLVRLGDFAGGKTQAEAVKALIIVLHREAAAAARKDAK